MQYVLRQYIALLHPISVFSTCCLVSKRWLRWKGISWFSGFHKRISVRVILLFEKPTLIRRRLAKKKTRYLGVLYLTQSLLCSKSLIMHIMSDTWTLKIKGKSLWLWLGLGWMIFWILSGQNAHQSRSVRHWASLLSNLLGLFPWETKDGWAKALGAASS